MERLAAAGELMAYRHTGFWQPMDTLRDKNLLETLWASRPGALEAVVNARPPASGGAAGCWSPAIPASRAPGWRCCCTGWAPRSPASRCRRTPSRTPSTCCGWRRCWRPTTAPISATARRWRRWSARHARDRAAPGGAGLRARGYAEPAATFATNVDGHGPCAGGAARPGRRRAAVMVTSDKVYRNDGAGRAFARATHWAGTIPTARRRPRPRSRSDPGAPPSPPRCRRSPRHAPAMSSAAVISARSG